MQSSFFIPSAALAIGSVLTSPAAAQTVDILKNISASRVVAISDGDYVAGTYSNAMLAPVESRFKDVLSVLSIADGRVRQTTMPLSNSVTAAPEILELTPDGDTAFVTERLGERPEGGTTVKDLPVGNRLFAADLSNADNPKLADTIEIADNPESLALAPQGGRVAVISNTLEASVLQIVPFENGRFGDIERFDLADLGIRGTAPGPRGGVTATNVHWHPSGRILAVNINTQNRIAFLTVEEKAGVTTLKPWGDPVEVGIDPFVGRFTPDGRHYLTSNWGRDFTAKKLEGRIPDASSTMSVIRLGDPLAGKTARHERLTTVDTGVSAEGMAISPDGTLVATINMRGSVFLPASARFQNEAGITLLSFDPDTGGLEKAGDYLFEGALPEGGTFDLTGDHLLATVFQGHEGSGPEAGAGVAVFRVLKGARPSLVRLGRVPLPHGVHHVDVSR